MKPLSKPFPLAGVKFAKEEANITLPLDLAAADVKVSHNPLNPYDAFALEVRINGHFCGHIPRAEQAAWFYFTSMNVAVVTKLLDFDRTRPPHDQIKVQFVCADQYNTTVVKQTIDSE